MITLLTLHSLLLNLISIASTLHISLEFQENLKVICASVEANVWSQLNLKMFLRKFDALVQCCVKILHKSVRLKIDLFISGTGNFKMLNLNFVLNTSLMQLNR